MLSKNLVSLKFTSLLVLTTAIVLGLMAVANCKTLVMVASPQGKILWDKFIPKYEKISGNKVKITIVPREQFDAFLKARLASGKQLDIIAFEPQFILDYYTRGILADLTGMFEDPRFPNLREERFKEGALDFKRMPGRKTYALPINVYMSFYLYNKTIFEKYGIPIPKDFKGLLTIKKKLEGTDILPIAYPGKQIFWNPFQFYTLLPMVTANYGNEFTKATVRGDIKWTSPFYVRAMELLKWEMDMGIITPESLGLDYDTLATFFLQGKVAAVYQGAWFYTEQIKGQTLEGFEVDVFLPPAIPPGKSQVLGCTDVLVGLNAKTANFEDAGDLLNYLVSDEVADYASHYYISSIKGYPSRDPILSKVLSLIGDMPIGHIIDHEWEPEITEEFKVQIQKMVLGEVTPMEALQTVQNVHDRLVKEGRDYGGVFGKTYSYYDDIIGK